MCIVKERSTKKKNNNSTFLYKLFINKTKDRWTVAVIQKTTFSIKTFVSMKNSIKIFLTVLGLFFYQSQIFAQTPNYTGTWVLNLEKSQLEHRPKGLTSSVFIIKQEGDKFRLTRYHIFGDKKKKISFKMVADAKTRSVKILFKGKLE